MNKHPICHLLCMHDELYMCFKLWDVWLAQIAQRYMFGYLSIRVRNHPILPLGSILPLPRLLKGPRIELRLPGFAAGSFAY